MEAYEIVRKIGDGSFGTVYLGLKKAVNAQSSELTVNSGSLAQRCQSDFVAIKKMKKRYYTWDECMKLREIRALKRLKHKNIVLLREVIREDNCLYLIFEHMDNNLYHVIRNQLVPFTESIIRSLVVQIVNGLAYMHRNGFFHRDIKPENLLCQMIAIPTSPTSKLVDDNRAETSQNNNQDIRSNSTQTYKMRLPVLIKIADFGLTKETNEHPPLTDYVSTRWYRAPELLLRSKSYDFAVDIWAVGCIVGELYAMNPLFPGRSEIDQIFKICQVLGPPNLIDWSEGRRLASVMQFNFPDLVPMNLDGMLIDCSSDGMDFIKSILQWNPDKRPRARELLKHSFIQRVGGT